MKKKIILLSLFFILFLTCFSSFVLFLEPSFESFNNVKTWKYLLETGGGPVATDQHLHDAVFEMWIFILYDLTNLACSALCGIKIYDLAKDLRGSVDKEAKADAKRKKLQAKLDQLSGEKTE